MQPIYIVQHLSPGDCQLGLQPVNMFSESTSRGLLAIGAACLYGLRTYLQGTVGKGCSMFIQFPYLLPEDCQADVSPAFMVSNIGLKTVQQQGISESVLYSDLEL